MIKIIKTTKIESDLYIYVFREVKKIEKEGRKLFLLFLNLFQL